MAVGDLGLCPPSEDTPWSKELPHLEMSRSYPVLPDREAPAWHLAAEIKKQYLPDTHHTPHGIRLPAAAVQTQLVPQLPLRRPAALTVLGFLL